KLSTVLIYACCGVDGAPWFCGQAQRDRVNTPRTSGKLQDADVGSRHLPARDLDSLIHANGSASLNHRGCYLVPHNRRRMSEGEEHRLRRIEADQDPGNGGKEKKCRSVNTDGMMQIERDTKSRPLPFHGSPLRAPPKHDPYRHFENQKQSDNTDNQLAGCPCEKTQVKLMNKTESLLGLGNARTDIEDVAVVRIDDNLGPCARWRTASRHIHQLTKVCLCRQLHHGYTGGSKVFFDRLNQQGLGQDLPAGADIPTMRMQPMVEVALKRHDAARQTQNDQKNGR